MTFALRQLENRPVESSVGIDILQSYGVVFLVREQADYSPAPVWRRGFCEHHRNTAHLLILLAESKLLDGTNRYLSRRIRSFLKSQMTVLNGEVSIRITRHTFETQDVGQM